MQMFWPWLFINIITYCMAVEFAVLMMIMGSGEVWGDGSVFFEGFLKFQNGC